MTSKFGLELANIKEIWEILSNYPQIKKAIIFGSRAKNTYQERSDIDLALVINNSQTDNRLITDVLFELEDLNTPLKFDVISYNDIADKALKKHIDTFGKTFYIKENLLNTKKEKS